MHEYFLSAHIHKDRQYIQLFKDFEITFNLFYTTAS